MQPTLDGFIAWARTAMGVPVGALPDNSVWWGYAFTVSVEVVNLLIAQASPVSYMLAVYNLAGDNLINWAQDTPPSTFFATARVNYKINDFAPGVVTSASDSSTSTSLTVLDSLKDMTLANLQNLKTPYGRTYLGIAQNYGTPWGIS